MDRVSGNPYQSPEVSEPQERAASITGPEMTRWPFTLALCGTIATTWAVMHLLNQTPIMSPLYEALNAIASLGCTVVLLWQAFARCRNIGIAGSWGLFLSIPGLNVLVLLALLALPEGFANRGKLDGPARVVLAGALLLVSGSVAILFVS